MAKRLTDDQMQRWVMMRIEYCADSGIGVAPHSSLAQEILAELDAAEEQPEEGEAEPGACGKNCTCPKCVAKLLQGCREIRLKAQIEKLTKERDALVAQVDRLMDADVNRYNVLIAENSDLKAKVEELEAERDELKDVIDQVRSVRDDLKAKVEELTVDRAHWEGSAGGWEKLYRIERALRESLKQSIEAE
jgi:DNA repair exonuclease SbcCD ATPase subunit